MFRPLIAAMKKSAGIAPRTAFVTRTLLIQEYRKVYLDALARRRALKIVVALKHYKNVHGHWPQGLDEVKAAAPAEAFTDPINDNSFVYKNRANTFTLYSKGKNGIDEDGQYIAVTDPNSVQVVVKEDDILFWPPMMAGDNSGQGGR